MRRTPIRMKLGGALAVPLVVLFAVTVAEIADISREADRVREQTDLARSTLGPSGLIASLQNERTWAVIELAGLEGTVQPPVVGYDESRAATDEALSTFRTTIDAARPAVADAYEPAFEALAGLADLRADIDGHEGPRDLSGLSFADEVFGRYAAMIEPFLDANTRVASAVDDVDLRQAASLVDASTRQMEVVADLARTSVIDVVIGGGLDRADEIAATARLKAVFDQTNRQILDTTGRYTPLVDDAFPHDMVEGFDAALDAAIQGDDVDYQAILAPLDVPADAGYLGLRNHLVEALNERADQLNERAQGREQQLTALLALVLAAAVGLTWLVSRSITKPLRTLTRQAREMADRRLAETVSVILGTPLGEDIVMPRPEPVRVRSTDEVADVADALTRVQDTALDLAVEQAVLRRNIADSFVNLGRRNQNLLGRQLDFITELEANETNPDTLANLFRLDHLATRMRRNAESLLVLAGIEPPRKWAAPVRLTDVIRAALSEVEDYQRVSVRAVEPATILGSAAADLAHLLAELIENALVFSPPDQTVDIRGRNRSEGGYTLAVIDSGMGMPPADIAAANRRLAGVESFTIAPSKYLGHYVAGNLAARHDIRVRLSDSPGNGITATIDLPANLLTTEPALGAAVTPPRGQPALPGPRPGTAPERADGAPDQDPSPLRDPGWLPAHLHLPAAAVEPAPAQPAAWAEAAHPAAPPQWAEPAHPTAPPQWAEPAHPTAPPQWAEPAHPTAPPQWAEPAHPTAPPGWAEPARSTGPRVLPRRRAPSDGSGDAAAGTTPAAIEPSPAPPGEPRRLVRRPPRPGEARPRPAPIDDAAIVAALGRFAPPRQASRGADTATPGPADRDATPFVAGPPPPAPQRAGPAPATTPPLSPRDTLARRVRGAQLPRTGITPLRGGRPAPPGRSRVAGAASGSVAARPAARPATDMQTLLTSFTAGVRRGLEEARRQVSGPAGHQPTGDQSGDHPAGDHRSHADEGHGRPDDPPGGPTDRGARQAAER